MSFLSTIIEYKKGELESAERKLPLREVQAMLHDREPSGRPFAGLIKNRFPGIIAEIKRKSPSKGLLRSIDDAGAVAKMYEENGAAAISVLTDGHFFGGSPDDLINVKKAVDIPVLRKDFIIERYQIYESLLYRADAILLISSALEKNLLYDLYKEAYEQGLEVLVETESAQDVEKIDGLLLEIVGVNNRDLHTFKESVDTSYSLYPLLPRQSVKICESGISSPGQIAKLYMTGYHGFLIGETFMRAEMPGETLRKFIEETGRLCTEKR